MRISTRWVASVVPAAIIVLLMVCPAPILAAIEELDGIVAVVNNDVIVRSELEEEIRQTMLQLQESGAAIPARSALEHRVLDQIVLERIQAQQAKLLGIEVDDAMLDEAISSIARRNGLTLEELQVTMESGGMNYEQFRGDTRQKMLTQRLQSEEVIKKIRVSDQEIDRFLETNADSLVEREEVRLQHILIALPEEPSDSQVEQARRKAQGLVAKLRAGADFAQTARTSSDGGRAQEGGDLGWFNINEVPSLVVEQAGTLSKGEISDPLRSPSGFHIIKMADIKGSGPGTVRQTHARHILIRTNELISDEDAQIRLNQLRIRIRGGADFDQLARSHSDDTGSALKGGDLGWVSPGDTVPAFETAMDSLGPNEVSEPFESPFGWHIIQVIERRDQDTSDEAMRLRAREAIQERKASSATDDWLQRLRDEAYIEIRID